MTAPVIDPVRRARAYLLRVAEPPAAALAAFVAARGPVEAAELVRAGQTPPGVREETAARGGYDRVEEDLAAAERVGARLVTPEDDEWPADQLAALSTAAQQGLRWAVPPLALWVRGTARLDAMTDRAVAVVGARAATGYGEHVAADFAYSLAEAGWTIGSGASYGIDAAAHRGALAADGVTVAVLGCGIDAGYPAGHVNLLDRITERGLLISEYPPGTQPARHRFPVRNRLLATLTRATIVVEAGTRSGARYTAACAAAVGREVMAVPGPITSAMSIGCHELLRSGTAIPVCSVAEILESVATGARSDAAAGNPGAALGTRLTRRPVADQIAQPMTVPTDTVAQPATTTRIG